MNTSTAATPDPKKVRKIAREYLLDDDLTADELDYAVRRHTGYDMPDDEFQEWRDAVDEAVQDATVTKTVSWPDEQPAAEEDSSPYRAVVEVMTRELPDTALGVVERFALDVLKVYENAKRASRAATCEVMWLTQDDEGNIGVWLNPDHARDQIIGGWSAETSGDYEWVNDVDRTRELLLRDGEPAGVELWMACVADAELDARVAKEAL
jgi:hypothetical protein